MSTILMASLSLTGCLHEIDEIDSDSSSNGSGSGSSNSGSSSSSTGSCHASSFELCVYYSGLSSSQFTSIRDGCTAFPGWTGGTNACESIATGLRQVCLHTSPSNGSLAKTYNYNLSPSQYTFSRDACDADSEAVVIE